MQRRDGELPAAMDRLRQAMEGMTMATVMEALIRAGCRARMGDVEATRAQIAILGSHASAADDDLIPAAWLGEAYALAGTREERLRIRGALARSPVRELCGRHMSFAYEGTTLRVLGLLDASLGDLAGAEAQLREAHALEVARQHAPWVAQTAYELGAVLRRAGKEHEARRCLDEAARIARDLGMTDLAKRAGAGAANDPGDANGVGADAGTPPAARHGPPVAPPVATPLPVRMERAAAGWNLARGATRVALRDSRGMQLLAKLVERPDEEIHVLALASGDESTSVPESSAGEILDDRARRAYRERLAALDEAIAEAEGRANGARAAKLQREKEAIVAELARAVGLGGRARQAGSATERARVNVQRRVKDAIARITEADEELGRFFESAVRTGTFCCFRLK